MKHPTDKCVITHKCHPYLGFVFGLCIMMASSTANACTAPVGVAGEIIFNNNHKVLQYCDGDDWVGLGWKGVNVTAAGTTNRIQIVGTDGKLAAAGIYFDSTNSRLGINTTTPRERVSVNDTVNLHVGGNMGIFFNAYYNSGGYFAGHGGGSKYGSSLLLNPNEGRIYFSMTPGMGVKDAATPLDAKFAMTYEGKMSINKNSPEAHLDINGDFKIQPGNALNLDVIRATGTISDTAVSVTPSNGITCTNTLASSVVHYTTCECPSGYLAINGGVHVNVGTKKLRESRSINNRSWRIACGNGTNNIHCDSVSITCARIVPN